MNSTAPGSRLVRIAARSPARSITGPAVTRSGAPISRAITCASAVLPRPGRAVEERVVERLAALARRLHEHAQVLLQRVLADELVERARAQLLLDPALDVAGLRAQRVGAALIRTRHAGPP